MADRDLFRRESSDLSQQLADSAKTLGSVTALMWILEILDTVIFSGGLDSWGIHPRTLSGLLGIFLAPFLHGGFGHLIANTLPFLVLGFLTMARKPVDFFVVSLISTLTAGLGAWVLGAPGTVHIGASGVIFGYLGFLLARGWYERRPASILLSLGVASVFGGMIWGVLPGLYAGVSWQSHLFGFIGGILAARTLGLAIRSKQYPQSRRSR